jgi:flagellar biosynthesis protein FliR
MPPWLLADPERALAVLLLLALRIGPLLLVLCWSLNGPVLGFSLALAGSLVLWPSVLALASPALQLSAAVPWELLRGVILALGALAPLLAFSWAGKVSEAAGFSQPPRALARIYALAALAVLFGSGAHLIVLRALLGSLSEIPLGAGSAGLQAIQAASLGLGQLLGRAFELGVVLASPVLLVTLTAVLLFGLSQRVSAQLSAALLRGPLLPLLGVSSACLCISSILGEVPRAAQVFLDKTLALLAGLH